MRSVYHPSKSSVNGSWELPDRNFPIHSSHDLRRFDCLFLRVRRHDLQHSHLVDLPAGNVDKTRMFYRFRWLLLFALFCESLAAARFSNCAQGWRRLVSPDQDTAVEIEIRNSDPILGLLTTRDGTVGGLLGDLPLPKGWRNMNEAETKALSWNSLNKREKRMLLQHVSDAKKTTFFQDRVLPNVRIRDTISLEFKEPTTFLGKEYPAGRHEIDISRVFNKVEYMGTTNDPANLELHFRVRESSGSASGDAWKFLDAIGVERTHQHAHIVSELPMKEMQADPELSAAMLGDFYRRANLVAEMISIVEEGSSISRNASRKAVFFDHMGKEMLGDVTQYFLDRGRGINYKIGDRYKMGWIGFRGSDKYDGADLFGLEYRAIPRKGSASTYAEVLDTIQWALRQKNYGISKKMMKNWIRENPGLISSEISATWYDRPWKELWKSAAPEVSKEVGWLTDLRLKLDQSQRQELKMLVHNWSNDPLLFEKPATQKRIVAAQLAAIRKLKKSVSPKWNAIMREFLLDSGLYDLFSRSLGHH